MKYFFDTEFIQYSERSFWRRKRKHFLELISIGIVAEDGREYYAISSDFDPHNASVWVKENVFLPIIKEFVAVPKDHPLAPNRIIEWIKFVQSKYGKPNHKIAAEIYDFVNPGLNFPVMAYNKSEYDKPDHAMSKHFDAHNVTMVHDYFVAQPDFYGWYADYDWVIMCCLFGGMMQMPAGMPWYCRDLKQTFDELGLTKEWKHKHCPDPADEHHALADAKWNKKLHDLMKNEKAIVENPIMVTAPKQDPKNVHGNFTPFT